MGNTIIMNRIINIAVLLLLTTITVNNASAQSKMTDEQKKEAKARYQEYKEKLNLTDDQSKKVDAINSTWFEGITALKNAEGPKLAKYKKLKSLNADRDKQMKAVLTKEQFKIYKQQQEERKEAFKQRRANRE
jgi:Spy/CpxP family protein refolding chaperone